MTEDLRKAAEAATPGPWVGFSDKGKLAAIMPAGRPGDVCVFEQPPSDEDGRFMLLANPAAILALYAERDAAIARAEKAEGERDVGAGVLCVIHRDGGHYIEAHGWAKAVEDAHLVWAALMERAEAAEASLAAVTAERDALREALTYAGEAIDTGRSEPLFIARDLIRNTLADLKEMPRVNTDICVLTPEGTAAVTITREPTNAE
ncbi:MAG: hypothetical protein FD152_535 [Xanthobacteraceae bacterium]|nr:MAG: hypothetical protein FD152_535 [Xanthobacteraceae bacterium]